MTPRRIVLSGCSGGGKSTLIGEMARRGWAVVAEPGRRIIARGGPLPWEAPEGFARAALDLALADARGARGRTLFDRCALDALCWFYRTGRQAPAVDVTGLYAREVYLAPPWPGIYQTDPGRRHGLAEALEEYEALCTYLPTLGHALVEVPRLPVAQRADWFEAHLKEAP